jgi:predicted RNA-binding Zn-ribbon protein involved in translation (DUF1610 family)
MSFSVAISVLLFYPFLYLLPLNLVRFRWGFEQGLAPIPPEVQLKAEGIDRMVLWVTSLILLMVVALLLHGSLISAYETGLTTDNWKSALGMGILFSIFPVGLGELLLRNRPNAEIRKDLESRGPLATWCGLAALGSFSHEFWRAFSIVALIRLGLPAWVAVLIAAVVYGTLHLQTSVAKALGSAAFGGAAGFLFVNTGSLLAPLTMGLIMAGANLYQVRQASSFIDRTGTNQGIHHSESRYSRPCPVCGAIIRLSEGHRAVDMLACPTCGEALTTDKKYLWGIAVVSLVTAAYVTRHLVYREPTYIFLTEGLALVLFLLGAFLLGMLVPPKYKLVGGGTFDKTMSLFGTDKSDTDKKPALK